MDTKVLLERALAKSEEMLYALGQADRNLLEETGGTYSALCVSDFQTARLNANAVARSAHNPRLAAAAAAVFELLTVARELLDEYDHDYVSF